MSLSLFFLLYSNDLVHLFFFFFQAEDGIRDYKVTGVQTCALPILLEVGNGGMKRDEYRTHMALWAILAAPLLAGNDLRSMSPETKELLMNSEILAVDQDAKGVQGRRVWQEGPLEIWVKPLADGSQAVGLFNRSESATKMTLDFKSIGAPASAKLRDLLDHKDLGTIQNSYSTDVPTHGVVLVKVSK